SPRLLRNSASPHRPLTPSPLLPFSASPRLSSPGLLASLSPILEAVMKRIALVLIAAALMSSTSGFAQQVPYLTEIFSRYERFNTLYKSMRKSGANLTAVEPVRRKGEEAFRSGNIPAILEAEGEAIALLEGKAWDERQKFLSSLTLEANRLIVEPNSELRVSLVRMFPADTSKAFAGTPTVTFEVVEEPGQTPAEGPRLSKPLSIADRLPIAEIGSQASRRLLIADGPYVVSARVEIDGKSAAELRLPIYAISGFSDSVATLSKTIANIKSSANPGVRAV